MNTGIQDGYNLAWKLALVLKDAASESLLETYDEERLANAKHLLRSTDRMFDVAAGNGAVARFFRDKLLPIVSPLLTKFDFLTSLIFPTISEVAINYRESSLAEHAGDNEFHVKAGDRMPWFLCEGASVYDRLRAAKFHLVLFSDGEDGHADWSGQVAETFGDTVDFTRIPIESPVTEIFGTDKPFQILLRPDNYIAFLSPRLSLELVEHWIEQLKTASTAN